MLHTRWTVVTGVTLVSLFFPSAIVEHRKHSHGARAAVTLDKFRTRRRKASTRRRVRGLRLQTGMFLFPTCRYLLSFSSAARSITLPSTISVEMRRTFQMLAVGSPSRTRMSARLPGAISPSSFQPN